MERPEAPRCAVWNAVRRWRCAVIAGFLPLEKPAQYNRKQRGRPLGRPRTNCSRVCRFQKPQATPTDAQNSFSC